MRNIYLIGMPSSGKSTLGRQLAHKLGYTFVDLDEMIVMDQGRSIPEIFSTEGESYFRDVESRLLKSIPINHQLLIATGGGAPCFFDNMDYIGQAGISVFVDVPVSELASRIRAHAKDDRPLLSGLSDLEAELSRKREDRIKFYSRADLTISPDMQIHQIIQLLQGFLGKNEEVVK